MARHGGNTFSVETWNYTIGNNFPGSSISLSTWYHLVVTQLGSTITLYLNGGSPESRAMPILRNITRNYTFLGYSNWNGSGLANADLDEVKIWNRALSAQEVSNDKNYNMSYIYTIN
jgi:hypothetical protein